MRIFRIRYLILLSSILTGCTSAYKDLQREEGSTRCVQEFVPTYDKHWFTASIDVRGHHLSGLLLIKKMPDGSQRIVFTNELGVSFFDFEFSDNGFKVIQVLDKLDKKPLINTLKQDFELLLFTGVENGSIKRYLTGSESYFAYPWDGKVNYIITDADCTTLLRLERGSEKKKLVQIEYAGRVQDPEKISINHFNFDMQIILTKIER